MKAIEFQEHSDIRDPHRESRATGIGVTSPGRKVARRYAIGAVEGLNTS
jgi:hypothetical protein